jgi:hypothetical protein
MHFFRKILVKFHLLRQSKKVYTQEIYPLEFFELLEIFNETNEKLNNPNRNEKSPFIINSISFISTSSWIFS